MALKNEFMASGVSAAEASKLGFDTPATTVAAAGSTQLTATPLVSNFSIVSSGGAGGVIITEVRGITAVAVTSGAGGTITVYPPVGGTINGAAVNVGLAVAVGKQCLFIPAGTNWLALLSA